MWCVGPIWSKKEKVSNMAELLVLACRLVLVLTSCLLVSSYCQTCTWHDAAVPVASVECRHTSSLLTVHYDTAVTCEQDLSGKNLTNAPTVSWSGAHAADIYLLIVIDPDASTPCKPDLRYVIHWAAFVSGSNNLRITDEFIFLHTKLKSSCWGNLSCTAHLSRGHVIYFLRHVSYTYRGPHPPEGTPPHRYQFFLYRWVPEITLLHPTFLGNDNSSRFHFDYDQFKAVNRLEHLEAFFEFQYSR